MAYEYELESPYAASAEQEARAAFIRRTYAHLAGAVLAFVGLEALLLQVVTADTIMAIFGRHYKSGSPIALRLLLGASAARAAMFLMNALSRAAGKGGRILLVQATASVLTLGVGLTLMPEIGTKGMAIGWLVGSLTAGVIALWWLIPSIHSGLRSVESTNDTGRARSQRYSPRHAVRRRHGAHT